MVVVRMSQMFFTSHMYSHLCCSGRTAATHKYISAWSVHWEMKGGNVGRFWGGQFSFFLAAILFTTIFLWCWEKNPLLTSLLSAQDQFIMQSSGLHSIENLRALITCQSWIFHKRYYTRDKEDSMNLTVKISSIIFRWTFFLSWLFSFLLEKSSIYPHSIFMSYSNSTLW